MSRRGRKIPLTKLCLINEEESWVDRRRSFFVYCPCYIEEIDYRGCRIDEMFEAVSEEECTIWCNIKGFEILPSSAETWDKFGNILDTYEKNLLTPTKESR